MDNIQKAELTDIINKMKQGNPPATEGEIAKVIESYQTQRPTESVEVEEGSYSDELDMSNTKTIIDKSEGEVVDAYLDSSGHPGLAVEKAGIMFGDAVNFVRPDGERVYVDLQNDLENEQKKLDELNAWYSENEEKASLGLWGTLGAASPSANAHKQVAEIENVNASLGKMYSEGGNNYRVVTSSAREAGMYDSGEMKVNSYKLTSDTGEDIEFAEWGDLQKHLWDNVTDGELGRLRKADLNEAHVVLEESKGVEAKRYEDLTNGDVMEELVSNGGIKDMLDSKASELNLSEEDQALFDSHLSKDEIQWKEWQSGFDLFGLVPTDVEGRFKYLHESVYNTKFGGDEFSEEGAEKVKSLFEALDLPSYDQTKLNKVKSQMADDFGSKWVQNKLKNHPNSRGIQAALDAETSSINMKPQFQAHKDKFENLEKLAKSDVKKIDAQTNSILSDISGLRSNGSDIGYSTKEINGKHIITVTGGDKDLVREYQGQVNRQQVLYNNVLGEYKKEHGNVVDKYDTWRASAGEYAKMADISNREMDTFTLMGEDLLGGFEQMALGMPAAFGSGAAMDGLEALQAESESLALDLGYDEALELGETGSYIGRSISKQTANVVAAVALSSLKMPKLTTEIAVGSAFGLASGGQKRQQLRTASRMAEQAELDIVELKALKDSMDPEEYQEQLAELEKIKKVGDLTRGQIEGIVWGTAMIEGVVTAKLGTLPNSRAMVKAFGGKGVGVNPFMTGNTRFGDFLWKFGKGVAGEIAEEEIILFGSEILEGTVNREHDMSFAEWDETLVQAVLLAGPMNGPSGAYSSVTQHMAGKEFREEFDDVIKVKDRLDRELKDPNLTDEDREKVSAEYWDNLARIGVAQSGLEADAMVTGADGLRELASVALSLRSLYTAADIKYTDSDVTKEKKIADHIAELNKKSKTEGQSFQDRYDRAIREKAKIHDATQAKYDEKSALDEDGLIKQVYGAKGLEMALEMAEKDPKFKKLSDRDKLVVLHEKIKKEFHDGQVKKAKGDDRVVEMIEGIVYNEVDEDGNKLEGGKEGYFKRNGKSRRTSAQVKREQELYEMWAVQHRSSQVEAMTLDKDVTLNAPPSLTEADIKSFDDILDSEGKVEKTALQQLEDFINKQDRSDSDKKAIIEGFRKGDVNGVIIGGKYIVLDAAQARKNLADGQLLQATAVFHEYSHFLDNVTMKEGEMVQMAENLNESLESNPILRLLHDAVVDRGSNILDSDGNPEYDTKLPFKDQSSKAKEEYVKYAEEMLLQNEFWKQLNEAKKAGGGIANTLKRFTGGDFNFTSKGAALHYIVEYGQSWLKGEDSKLVERKKKAFVPTSNEEGLEVEDKFSRTRIKKVTKVGAKETVYEAVNKLAEGVKTNAEWVKRENIDKAVRALKLGGAISNLVRDPARGMTLKEQNLTIQELRIRLKNFNPEAKRKTGSEETITFIEFVNSNIRFGRLDARLELAITAAETKLTKSIDATTSEGKQAFEIEAETDVNVQAFEDQDMSMAAQSRRLKLAEQGKSESDQYSSFRKELGLDEAMMDKIRKAVVKTFGTKLPDINSKKFRAALEKAYRTELKMPIQDMMGKGDVYNEFLDKTFPIVYRFLTKEALVQMERLVGGKKDKENGYTSAQRIFTTQRRITKSAEVDKLIEEGKLPKDTSRVSGPNLIEKLPYPGKKKILAYFRGVNSLELLGYEREPSDFGTRKDRVAEQMGVELGFDATMETVQDPEVNKRRESILELTGQAQAANDLVVIAKQIDRDPNMKFSMKLDKAVAWEKNALHKIALLGSSLEVAPFSMVDSKEIQTVGRLISEVGAHSFLKRTQELANNILAVLVPIENDPKNQKAKDDFSKGAIRGAIIATYGDVFNDKDLERLVHAIHAVATSNKLPKTNKGKVKINDALKIQLDKLITDNDSKTAQWFGTGKTTMSLMSDPKKIALRRAETVDFMIKDADRINEDSASPEEAGLRIMRSMNMLKQQMSTAGKVGGKRAQYFLGKDFLETMNKNIPGLSFSIKEDGGGFKVDFSKPVTYKGKVLSIKASDLTLDTQTGVGVIKDHISDILTGTTKVKDREVGVREAREHLNNYVAYYVGLYEAGIIGAEDLQMAAANLLSNMNPSLARAAMPKFIAEDMLPPNWESMSKKELNSWITQNLKGDLKPVFEHMQPRLLVILGLFEAHLFNGGVTDVDAHFANYDVAIISDRMDKGLKAANLNNSLTEGQTLSMESWIRYYNAVTLATGKMKSLFGIGSNDGVSVGEGHQLASEILKERLEGLDQAARANGLLAFSKSPKPTVKQSKMFNGSSKTFSQLGDRTGVIFLASDEREAEAYAESNGGTVRDIYVDQTKVGQEQQLLSKIEELGYSTEDALAYELIDTRFPNSLKQSEIDEVIAALKEDGLLGIEYTDGAQVVSGTTKSTMIFDKSIISETPIITLKSKGITVLDFDDTLATTKSGVKARIPNPDGTPKPGRKVIFMAGGAGSGKGNVISKLGLGKAGYKLVNSDISLEWLKKNHGLPENQSDYTAEQRSQLSKLSAEARKIAKRKQGKFAGNGDGVVVDGTGGSIKMMEKLVEEFKAKGYDVSMVFVETSLEVAQQRNAARSERSIREGILNKNHEQVQGNKEGFKALFGETFNEVSTDKIGLNDALPGDFKDKVDGFTNSYENRRLDAEEFAKEGSDIKANGGEFDFSEFNQVVEGETAPMFNKAMKLSGKFGTGSMFILTARSPESAPAIKEFLDAQGLNIPLENITGLGQSEASAKANWIAEKIGEGYNDFYFADDATQNVEAVQDMLDQFDVKGKVQQARTKFSKSGPKKMSTIIAGGKLDINTILEQTKGVDRKKVFSTAKARKRGRDKGKFKFFIPPSADDFAGLMYAFMGKGKQGEQHHEFFKEKLFDPFSKGIRRLNQVKQAAASDLRELRKATPDVRKKLDKTIPGTEYTYEDAIRVYNWVQAGFEVAGLSATDKQALVDTVKNDSSLSAFAQGISAISAVPGGLVDPGTDWMGGNIALDLKEALDVARGTYLQQWKENVSILFNEANLNKIEAVYGSNFREALEDSLWRMEHGGNRSHGGGRLLNNFTNWIHGSIGTTMFLNARSAMLQMISNVNFVNWSDNNMIAAAKAFGNQPQYWKDVAMIFNSPFLKQRRSGIQTDVNAAELLAQLKDSKNKAKAATAYLLQLGFTPTQIADSFAIATGGATFYRNRTKTYLKEGMTQVEAETKAFEDMMEIAEETQQSTREDKISQQQASPLGKFILAFQNTPMQYNRLIKKAALDLVNGRGDPKANISRIVYYGAIQNLIFYGLQAALFSALFSDDEEDQITDEKKERIMNGMVDTLLRGSGIGGAIVATVKNVILRFLKEEAKETDGNFWTEAEHANTLIEALNISPPIGIKARKLYGASLTWDYNRDVIKHMSKADIDNPIYDAVSSATQALTNLPLNRLYSKYQNISEALNADNKTWERVAMFLGWSKWNFGIKDQDVVTAKGEAKIIKSEDKKNKAREVFVKDQEEERAKGEKDIKCAASTKSGNRCGKKVLGGGNYCTIHVEVPTRSDGKKTQCSHIKSGGKRCKMQTSSQSGKCYYHD